jgi:hypothetical protein
LNATRDSGELKGARTAISKWVRRQLLSGAFILLIYLYRVFKSPGRQTMGEIKGDFDRLQVSICGSFPQGRRESMARLRVQIASEGVNGFVKAIRWKTES